MYVRMKYIIILIIISCCPGRLLTFSTVYNLRIAQMTKQSILDKKKSTDRIFLTLAFDEYRKQFQGSSQNSGGSLFSFIYDFNYYYFRTDFAVSFIKEINATHETTFCGLKTDDLLFTLGRSFRIGPHSATTVSVLGGVPTHKVFRLQHIDFGYGQIGLGGQWDGTHGIFDSTSLLYALRYIYFFPRTAHDSTGMSYCFSLGNISDFLLGYKYRFSPHEIENGYTMRIQYGAQIDPYRADIIKRTNFVRSSLYAVYKYTLEYENITHRFLFNVAYGTEHVPHPYRNKYIITIWGAWNVMF